MWACTFIITLSLLVFVAFQLFNPYFFQIDTCLDRGGKWNYEIKRCEGID